MLGENRRALGLFFLEASTGVPYEVKNSLYLLRAPLGKPARQPVEGVSQRRW